MADFPSLFRWIKRYPKQVIGFITFITGVAGFIILFRDNQQLIVVTISTAIFITVWLISLRIAFAKTAPLIEGGKGVYKYPSFRLIALINSFFIMPLVGTLLIFPENNRQYFVEAFSGTSSLSVQGTFQTAYVHNWGVIPKELVNVNDWQANHAQANQKLFHYFVSTKMANLFLPEPSGDILYDLNIQNNTNDKEWYRISNSILVSVTFLKDNSVPLSGEYVYFSMTGGGLGPHYRQFPPTPLEGKSYEAVFTDTEADSFSLQPGEYEDFLLDLVCKSPGIYRIDFKVAYASRGISGYKTVTAEKFICPISYTYVIGHPDFLQLHKFNWENSQYVPDVQIQKHDLYVVTSNGAPLILRQSPSSSSQILAQLPAGTTIVVYDGPVQSNGYDWWHVYNLRYEDIQGWIEGNSKWFTLPGYWNP